MGHGPGWGLGFGAGEGEGGATLRFVVDMGSIQQHGPSGLPDSMSTRAGCTLG